MMKPLPPIDASFPPNSPGGIRRFWIRYWAWFFLLLPWMLLRQIGIALAQAAGVLWTWNRQVYLLNGALRLIFMNNLPAMLLSPQVRNFV